MAKESVVERPFAVFREECRGLVIGALNEEGVEFAEDEVRLAVPSAPDYGNLSFSTFVIAKKNGKNPKELADSLASRISSYGRNLVERVESAGAGYVNFFVNYAKFAEVTLEAIYILRENFGRLSDRDEKVIVEHTSVNPIHPIHVGGARNAVIGDTLARILSAAGYDVRRHFYIDDVGLQVAQASYGYSKLGDVPVVGKSDHFVGFVYASTSCAMSIKSLQKEIERLKVEGKDEEVRERLSELDDWVSVASELRAKNEKVFDAIYQAVSSSADPEGEVAELLKRYERKEEGAVRLIRKVSELALAGFKETLQRADIEFDSWDWESELTSWNGGAETVVEWLLRSGFGRVEEGTAILDCEEVAKRYGLKEKYGIKGEVPPLTLKRSDGTTLYTTRDIAYTMWKFDRAEKVINVISLEQKLPQLQLKLALYALNLGGLAENLVHFSYELVHLPGKKMSGRRGRYVTFDEVMDEAVERAYEEVSKRSPHLSEEERRKISELVGVGAVRYALAAVAPNKPITFTWERVLNFEQNSAPFIQYAHARASNILAKAGQGVGQSEAEYAGLSTKYERELVVKLSMLPEIVNEAAENLRPELIAEYANDLSSAFNLFYDNVPVLKTEEVGLREARLRLVEGVKTVLSNALYLMGIRAPTRM
ncbi:MAG: arginine--tRNA ligase [Candidatus Methanomethylicaceae archaeon]|nr:arginine--tRNA ligase [Candidatus Verstraetearchaeota archaeon]